MWVVQDSECVTTEKLGDEGLKGMSTPLLSAYRRLIDLELRWYDRVDGVSAASRVFFDAV
jgi:hypothetical protein